MTKNLLEGYRGDIIRLMKSGKTIKEITKLLKIHPATVANTVEVYEDLGEIGFIQHKGPRGLDRDAVKKLLLKGPAANGMDGYNGELWTNSAVRRLIFREYGTPFIQIQGLMEDFGYERGFVKGFPKGVYRLVTETTKQKEEDMLKIDTPKVRKPASLLVIDFSKNLEALDPDGNSLKDKVFYQGPQTTRYGNPIKDDFKHLLIIGDKMLFVNQYGQTFGQKANSTPAIRNPPPPPPAAKPAANATQDGGGIANAELLTAIKQMTTATDALREQLEKEYESNDKMRRLVFQSLESHKAAYDKAATENRSALERAVGELGKLQNALVQSLVENQKALGDQTLHSIALLSDEIRKIVEVETQAPDEKGPGGSKPKAVLKGFSELGKH
jgi:transposase